MPFRGKSTDSARKQTIHSEPRVTDSSPAADFVCNFMLHFTGCPKRGSMSCFACLVLLFGVCTPFGLRCVSMEDKPAPQGNTPDHRGPGSGDIAGPGNQPNFHGRGTPPKGSASSRTADRSHLCLFFGEAPAFRLVLNGNQQDTHQF